MKSLTPLTLPAAPTADLHAATKKYVDDNAGSGGGTPDGSSVIDGGTATSTGQSTLDGGTA